jgi:hypothetical protein
LGSGKSSQQAQLLKIIKTGITETRITGVGTSGVGTSEFRVNRNWDNWRLGLVALGQVNFGITETGIIGVHSFWFIKQLISAVAFKTFTFSYTVCDLSPKYA